MTENEKKLVRGIRYERKRRIALEKQMKEANQFLEQVRSAYIMAFHIPYEEPKIQQRHLMELSNLLYGI